MNEILRHKMLRQKKVSFNTKIYDLSKYNVYLITLEHMNQMMKLYFICTIANKKGGIQNIIFFIVNSGDECP